MSKGGNLAFARHVHPTYDRSMFRRMIVGFVMMSSIAIPVLSTAVGEWAKLAALVGFVLGVVFLVSKKINTCPCPACGRWLTREPHSAEFDCISCSITWTTRWRGQSIWDM